MRLQTRPSSPWGGQGFVCSPAWAPDRSEARAGRNGGARGCAAPRSLPPPTHCSVTSRRCGAGPLGNGGTGFEARNEGAPTLGPVSCAPTSQTRTRPVTARPTARRPPPRAWGSIGLHRGLRRKGGDRGAQGLRTLRVLDRSSRPAGSCSASLGALGLVRRGPRLGDGFVRAGGGGAEGGSGRGPEVGPAVLLPFGGDTSFPLLPERPRPGTGCVLLEVLRGRPFAVPGNFTLLAWPCQGDLSESLHREVHRTSPILRDPEGRRAEWEA